MAHMQRNTATVWDEVWQDPGLVKQDDLILATEAATIRWRKIAAVLRREFGSLDGLRAIEIGSGSGTYGALLAQAGARTTVVDYSSAALARARDFYTHNGLAVTQIQGDALLLSRTRARGRFDIAISVGLTEHFKGPARLAIHKAHLDVLRPGGIAIFIVPNRANPPYRIYKGVSQLFGRWKFGEEYPFSRQELLFMCSQLHASVVSLFGDDLYTSLRFLLPANFLRRFFRVGLPRAKKDIRVEKGTPLDGTFGYSFILMVRKL